MSLRRSLLKLALIYEQIASKKKTNLKGDNENILFFTLINYPNWDLINFFNLLK